MEALLSGQGTVREDRGLCGPAQISSGAGDVVIEAILVTDRPTWAPHNREPGITPVMPSSALPAQLDLPRERPRRTDGGCALLVDRHLQAPRHRSLRVTPRHSPSPADPSRGSARGAAARHLVRVASLGTPEESRLSRRIGKRVESEPSERASWLRPSTSGAHPCGGVTPDPRGVLGAGRPVPPGDDRAGLREQNNDCPEFRQRVKNYLFYVASAA
jgi:hypothetical protein